MGSSRRVVGGKRQASNRWKADGQEPGRTWTTLCPAARLVMAAGGDKSAGSTDQEPSMSSDPKPPPTVEDPKAPLWQRVHLWQIQSVRDLMMLAAIVGLIWVGYLLSIVTVPLLVALGLAYLVEPLVQWLSQRVPWLGRRGAVLSLMGILGLVLALVLILTVPLVVGQATQLMKNSDRYLDRARAFVADKHLPVWVQDGLGTLADFLPMGRAPSHGDGTKEGAAKEKKEGEEKKDETAEKAEQKGEREQQAEKEPEEQAPFPAIP